MNKNLVKATQFQAFTILLDCMRQTDKATKYGILIPLPYSKWRSKFFYNFTIVFVLYSQVTFETNYLFSLNVLRMGKHTVAVLIISNHQQCQRGKREDLRRWIAIQWKAILSTLFNDTVSTAETERKVNMVNQW
jgi:hypothetical protein